MSTKFGRLPIMVTAVACAAALTPHVAAATTVSLFPAHVVSIVTSGQPVTFDSKSIVMLCGANSLTIIESPGNPTGVVADNFLNESARRLSGAAVFSTQNLCTTGNGAPPLANSCFSSASPSAFTPGTLANNAYQGVGTLTAQTVPGLAVYTFQLINAAFNGNNPQASTAMRLRTSCLVGGGDAQRGAAAAKK